MSITNCNCMKINTASFVQCFPMCCPFSAITNRTRDRNPSMALLITAWGNASHSSRVASFNFMVFSNLLPTYPILWINYAVKLKIEATSLSGQYHYHLPARSLTTVELGISKLLSFKKRFVSIQALLRHNEYRKANYKKKVTLPAKKPLNAVTHFVKRDCSL